MKPNNIVIRNVLQELPTTKTLMVSNNSVRRYWETKELADLILFTATNVKRQFAINLVQRLLENREVSPLTVGEYSDGEAHLNAQGYDLEVHFTRKSSKGLYGIHQVWLNVADFYVIVIVDSDSIDVKVICNQMMIMLVQGKNIKANSNGSFNFTITEDQLNSVSSSLEGLVYLFNLNK